MTTLTVCFVDDVDVSTAACERCQCLRANSLSGAFPDDLLALPGLAGLHLQRNAFSGALPPGLAGLKRLQVLDLSFNAFNGTLPGALSNLTQLVALNLSNNSLSGRVPDLGLPALQFLNLSNNHLNGPVPGSLLRFSDASFAGNNIRQPAEVLGKGAFGTAYRALLEDATTVVVKRLKEVSAGRREFEQQMELIGRVRHDNVAELRAYYYSKDEKLLVYDYYSRGSVSNMLHGKRGLDRTPLDWETRVRIALGAARGIAHIHTENNGKFVHGNIKASNVFLNSQQYGCISDLGLAPLMNPITARSRSLGYCAPEITDTRKSTQCSDVYSFGVFVLELLTGKSPVQVTGGGNEVVHLVRWVQSVVREEWTAEVFDGELMRYPNIEEEMVEMLQIAMACVSRNPERRPKMLDMVKMIEEVGRNDSGTRASTEASTPVGEARNKAESSSAAP
uniref:Putative inactive receptor kinase n=1 Tax=Aegilops tauschii TaxID=37682 RepID=M8BQ69_AEGTA